MAPDFTSFLLGQREIHVILVFFFVRSLQHTHCSTLSWASCFYRELFFAVRVSRRFASSWPNYSCRIKPLPSAECARGRGASGTKGIARSDPRSILLSLTHALFTFSVQVKCATQFMYGRSGMNHFY